jgi:hypothetical protein
MAKGYLSRSLVLVGRSHMSEVAPSSSHGEAQGDRSSAAQLRSQHQQQAPAPLTGGVFFVAMDRATAQRALGKQGDHIAPTPLVLSVGQLAAAAAGQAARPQVVDVSGTLHAMSWPEGGVGIASAVGAAKGVSGGLSVGAARYATARSATDPTDVFVRTVPAYKATETALAANPSQGWPVNAEGMPDAAMHSLLPTPSMREGQRLAYASLESPEAFPQCSGAHSWKHRAEVGDLIPPHGRCLPGETSATLLTVFTTLMMRGDGDVSEPHTQQKVQIQRNVLHGLAALSPEVRTVVFTDSALFGEMAVGLGMVVVSGVRSTSFGLPYLRSMYEWVDARSSAPLYGYMNGDILFGPRLIELCQVTLEHIEAGLVLPRVLLTGRRYNADMPFPLRPDDAQNIATNVSREQLQERVDAFRGRSRLFQADAEDYFFINRGTWKWEHIPDFVPGRSAYDNFLVEHAYRDMVERVDMTRCVFAVHQSGSDGHKAGLDVKRAEPNFNLAAMTHYIGGFSRGTTDSCNLVLQCKEGQKMGLQRHKARQRSGERGAPWTGYKYHGWVDPMGGRRWLCDKPGPRGQLMGHDNGCHWAP